MWEGGLSTIAVGQSSIVKLVHRHREQAPSHILTESSLR